MWSNSSHRTYTPCVCWCVCVCSCNFSWNMGHFFSLVKDQNGRKGTEKLHSHLPHLKETILLVFCVFFQYFHKNTSRHKYRFFLFPFASKKVAYYTQFCFFFFFPLTIIFGHVCITAKRTSLILFYNHPVTPNVLKSILKKQTNPLLRYNHILFFDLLLSPTLIPGQDPLTWIHWSFKTNNYMIINMIKIHGSKCSDIIEGHTK